MRKILTLLIGFCLSSCTMTVYTQKIRNQLYNSGINPEETQFYIINDIRLSTEKQEIDRKTEKGTITNKRTITRSKINFGNAFTSKSNPLPCVAKSTESLVIQVYFEKIDSLDNAIRFFKNKDNKYQLYTSAKSGLLWYEGVEYSVESGENTLLYVSKKDISKKKTEKRSVKGLTL